jgi:hypothetical protein
LQGQVLIVIDSLGNLITTQEKKKIDDNTAINLITMLRSPDKENFNMAILAIEQLKK